MREELGITKLKVIIIFFVLFLMVYILFVVNKGDNSKKKKYNFVNEENQVVYRENSYMTIDPNTIARDGDQNIVELDETEIPEGMITENIDINSLPVIEPSNDISTMNTNNLTVESLDADAQNEVLNTIPETQNSTANE